MKICLDSVLQTGVVLQKFEVTEWPKEDYGKFFSGDSYIILNVSN